MQPHGRLARIAGLHVQVLRSLRFLRTTTMRAGLCVAVASPLSAQHARLAIAPEQPLPGAIIRVTLRDAHVADDSIVAVRGMLAGEPLHFLVAGGGFLSTGAGAAGSRPSLAAA